jgi:hypothetical protein
MIYKSPAAARAARAIISATLVLSMLGRIGKGGACFVHKSAIAPAAAERLIVVQLTLWNIAAKIVCSAIDASFGSRGCFSALHIYLLSYSVVVHFGSPYKRLMFDIHH